MAEPRIVLVHGSMDTSASFAEVVASLGDATVYDRRGYGEAVRGGPADVAGHVDDLLAVLVAHPAFVVGHSFGGVVALAAAAKAPELVSGMLVYEPPMPWLSWWPPPPLPDSTDVKEIEAAAERFLRRHMGDRRWEALSAHRRAAFLDWAPGWAHELWSVACGPPPFEPGQLRGPLTVAYGTATDERHERSAKVLAGQVPGARLERIEGGTHQAHRLLPAEFAGLVRQVAANIART